MKLIQKIFMNIKSILLIANRCGRGFPLSGLLDASCAKETQRLRSRVLAHSDDSGSCGEDCQAEVLPESVGYPLLRERDSESSIEKRCEAH